MVDGLKSFGTQEVRDDFIPSRRIQVIGQSMTCVGLYVRLERLCPAEE